MARKRALFIPPFGPAPAKSSLLFSQVLSAQAASIDTGANGIAPTFNQLLVYAILQTSNAGNGNCNMTFNGDNGAHYDAQVVAIGPGGGLVSVGAFAQTSLGTQGPATAGVHYPGMVWFTIPGYAQTTYYKIGWYSAGDLNDVTPNGQLIPGLIGWRNTAAINQITFVPNAGATNLLPGSAVWVYGQ